MSRMEKASQRVGHDTDDVSKYRRYVQAKLRTRVEMWRRTGNPLWLTEDQAQEDAFGLLGSLVSRLPDAALAQQTVDFLTIRAAAVSPKKRSRELMELGRASSILRVHGMSVEIRLPDMADPPRDGKTATKLPDLTALMRFCNEAKATPTHRAFGEFIIDRLGDYNETFFTGLDALAFNMRELGDDDLADSVKELEQYIRTTKKWASERGVRELRNDLAWGEAREEVNRLAAGTDDRAAMDEQLSRLGKIIEHTSRTGRHHLERLSELATMLLERYQRSERLDDLDECIRVQRQAVRTTARRSTDRVDALANLSLLFSTRFDHREAAAVSGRPAALPDLNEAIKAASSAVRLTPRGHTLRANRLGALATMLLKRFGKTTTPADLDAAITSLEDALKTGNLSEAERGNLESMLGAAQALRGQGTAARAQDPRRALHARLERVQSGDKGLLLELLDGEEAHDEVLAALAGFGHPPDAGSDMQLLVDAINFLRFGFLLPSAQFAAQMRISQSISQQLDEFDKAATPEEHVKIIRALPEVVRRARADLQELWGSK